MMFVNKVTFWNDVIEKEDKEVNIVYGETFQEALDEVISYYGEDILYVSLEPIGDELNDRMFHINDNISRFILKENK